MIFCKKTRKIKNELDIIKNSIENLMNMRIDEKIDNQCLIDTLAKLHCCLTQEEKCNKCFRHIGLDLSKKKDCSALFKTGI